MKVAIVGGIGVYAQEELIKKAIEKPGNEVEVISTEEAERGITLHSVPQEEVIKITDPYQDVKRLDNNNYRGGKQARRERRKQERKLKK